MTTFLQVTPEVLVDAMNGTGPAVTVLECCTWIVDGERD
jgi:hypothetical protein